MKRKTYNHKPIRTDKSKYRRLRSDYCGTCELRQLPKGTYFRTVGKNGKVSKETYTKDYYEPSTKTFCAVKHSDVWGNGRSMKGTQKVTTDFIY